MRRAVRVWQLSLAMVAGTIAAEMNGFGQGGYGLEPVFLACLGLWNFCSRVVCTGFCLGVAAGLVAGVLILDDRLDPHFAGDSVLTRIEVAGFPERRGESVRFLARPIDDQRLPTRLLVRWRSPPAEPRAGDTWEVVVRLRVPRGLANPGGRDAEAGLYRRRIGATGYVVAGPRNRLLSSDGGGQLPRLRRRIVERILAAVEQQDSAAVLIAIAVGARHRLSQSQWERFARTGTSHLMAISGLHVGLAGAFAYGLTMLVLTALRIRAGNRHVAGLAALAAAGFYTALSGFGVPAVRAFIMIAIALLARFGGRAVDPAELLGLAAALVLIGWPEAVSSAGFVLSFGAVACLLWLAQSANPVREGQASLVTSVGAAFRMQWVLLAGLLPFTLLLFDRASLAAPFVNLVVVPIFSFATVPTALAGTLLAGPTAPLGDRLLELSAASIGLTDTVVAWGGWPEGRYAADRGMAGWALVVLAATWAVLPRGWPGRIASLPALAATLCWQPATPAAGCFRLNMLDVGQGQAVLVETRSTALLFDTGPGWRDGGNLVRSVIRPALAHRGIRRLDVTVISHADLDHAGGWPALSSAMPTGRLLAGEPLDTRPGSPVSCHSVRPWIRDGVRFRFLSVPTGRPLAGNDRSCVLEIATGSQRALLTGDIERTIEEALVRDGHVRRAAVVTVPHHGSRTSSSTAFIDAARPAIAVVSSAYDNRWGQPRAEVVRRWERAGARVYNTATDGAVIITLCADGMGPLERLRRDRQRIWQSP